jgi:hypothetical protein
MFGMSSRLLIGISIATLASGCSQEYNFPSFDNKIVEAPKDFGSWLSMDTAPDNRRIAIAYYDRSNTALGFAVGTPSAEGSVTWKHEEVDGYADSEGLDRGDKGKYCSMKVAPDGTVWVAYYDVTNGGLWAAHRRGFDWETTMVDSGAGAKPNAGQWASLDLNNDGNPVIAHHDSGKGTLRVSRFSDGAWTTEDAHTGEDYNVEVDGEAVYRAASVGTYANLQIHNGTEYIAFYDAAQQTLNLLEGFAGAYTHTVVDSSSDVGQWPSLWTDGTELHIAYHDVAGQNLKLASRSGGGSFSLNTIDSGEFRGADTEVFKHNEQMSIVYFDGHDNNMMRAEQTGTAWNISTVGGETAAVGFHNESTVADGRLWVGSYDFTNRTLFIKDISTP